MNKGLAISGGVLILLSLFSLVFSLVVMDSYEPNSDNILHDTETDGMVFNFDGSSSWLEVYAKGEVDCYSYSISVTDDMFEYFYPNCDSGTEIAGYTYLGDLEIYDAGSYNIDAEGNVVIVDADDLIGTIVCILWWWSLLPVGRYSFDCWILNRSKDSANGRLPTTRWNHLSTQSNDNPAIHPTFHRTTKSATNCFSGSSPAIAKHSSGF